MPSTPQEDKNEPWLEMNLKELEKEYSPSKWSKRLSADKIISAHIKSTNDYSKSSRANIPNRLDVVYGHGPLMKLDVFGEDLPSESAVLVYVHGGYWQDLNKEISAYVVQPMYENGIVTVVVGYDQAPQITLADIVVEVKAAIAWSCGLARSRGSKGVVLAGHSAGGQLITQVLSSTLKSAGGDLPKEGDLIRGVVPISGVFDLRPLVKTYVNKPLKLTESSAWEQSPMGRIQQLVDGWSSTKLLVVVGQHESPEFQRQSKQYFQRCLDAGMQAEYLEVEAADHFNIVEDLAKTDFSLTKKIIEFIKTCVAKK